MMKHDPMTMAHPGYQIAAQALRDARDLREALDTLAKVGVVPEKVSLSNLSAAIEARDVFTAPFRELVDCLLASANAELDRETRHGTETYETGCDGAAAYAEVPTTRLTARGAMIEPAVTRLRRVAAGLDLLLDAIAAKRAVDQLARSI